MTPHWPSAHPSAGAHAVIKAVPEDFRVEELSALPLEPADAGPAAGEHLYLRLRKRGIATPEAARWLADCYRVPPDAVGYAGMKDKHAVTEQWFSVRTPCDAGVLPARDGLTLVAAARGRRKLRRGQLDGNRFEVRLRDVHGTGWCRALAALRDDGAPNYFGPQRFGADNLERARAWLDGGRRGRRRSFRSGLYLSVLRSFLFNEVLGLRVRDGSWNRPVAGDVLAVSCGSGLQTANGSPGIREPELASTSQSNVPTGPLWGRGRSPAGARAGELEALALAPHAELCHGLEHAGLVQERRSLVLKPAELLWRRDGADVVLRFSLPRGGYATCLLAEAFALVDGSRR